MRLIRSHVPVFFILASFLLLLFVNLSGVTNGLPGLWWSEVTNESGLVRWYSYKICLVGANNEFLSCTDSAPATPYSPVDKYIGYRVPVDFLTRRSFFFYTSSFAFAGFLIAVIFTGLALLFSILDMVKIFQFRNLILILTVIALLFVIAAATTQTAAHVTGTNIFKKYQMPAKVGAAMFGLMWSSFVALLISVLLVPKTTLGKKVAKG